MAWYWWVLIGIGALVLFSAVSSALAERPAARQRRAEELSDMFEPVRREMAIREEEGRKAVGLILALPVAVSPGAGDVQSRDKVTENVMNMARTRHVRTHVSVAPEKVCLLQEIPGQPGKTMVRIFARRDAENWIVRTRMGQDFDGEVRAAQAGEGEGR